MLTSAERMLLIDPGFTQFSIRKQCELLNVNRSSHYYVSQSDPNADLEAMGLIDKLYTAHPFLGYRRISKILQRHGHLINPKRVLRLMNVMGIQAIHPGPMTSNPNPEHKIYPYLLKNILIVKPNQVWAADVTYIRMLHGFLYLVAVLDWFSRYVVSWRLSCSLEAMFCVDALKDALSLAIPEVFNTDQGSQFTSEIFTGTLQEAQVAISMDGRGRCMDNIFTERLWRTVKYEEVYLKDYLSLAQAEKSLKEYFLFYNHERPHQALGYKTPAEMHYN